MQQLQEIINLIDKSIKEDLNNFITWWWIICDNYNDEVDELRNLINY